MMQMNSPAAKMERKEKNVWNVSLCGEGEERKPRKLSSSAGTEENPKREKDHQGIGARES